MDRESLKSHFRFNKQERSGIFFLLLLIVVFQTVYFIWQRYPVTENTNSFVVDEEYQVIVEELKSLRPKQDTIDRYPFNPNFITDYKGYLLGMSTEEIDRLHAFRAANQFVNSVREFQQVTLISDSLLESIQPYFRFPDWTYKEREGQVAEGGSPSSVAWESSMAPKPVKPVKIRDLNKATAEELRGINGIGDRLSRRIVKFRDLLGGFLSEAQLGHVYGLKPEVIARILERYGILDSPPIAKININRASPRDISKLIYIKYEVAARIVAYRDANGGIASFDELVEIEDFPSEKLDIIKLYLQL